jgi:type III secretion protein D
METKPSNLEMFVLSGEQEGARTILKNDISLTISGGMDTDVMLRDPAITDEKVSLVTKNNEVYIQVLSGDIQVQGRTVNEGKYIKVPEFSKIQIGNTILSYGKQANASWKDILDYVSQCELKSVGSRNLKTLLMTNAGAYLLSLLVFFVLVSFLWLYLASNNQSTIKTFSSIDDIHSLLIEENYESLRLNENENGQIVISGFLMTNGEKSNLENLVESHDIRAILDITTGDRLATEVRDLYRVNGLDVEVKPLGVGVVLVTSEPVEKTKFDKIKTVALSEIPGLTELETEYTGTFQDGDTVQSTNEMNSEDKRITMVVDGTPAYLMTSDQSKYYIGAVLPTGHTIVSINNHKVILEKNGKQTTLNF